MAQVGRVYQCVQAFHTHLPDGRRRTVAVGAVVKESDPVLKGRGKLFRLISDVQEAPVEQATAAPGERRALVPPVQRDEQDEPDLTCGECGFEAKAPVGLRAHMRKHERE